MATYFINSENTTGGVSPYNSISTGFPNFHTLLSTVTLNDGDVITVTSPYNKPIDDSVSTIQIINKITINATGKYIPQVKLIDNGIGMQMNLAGSTITGIGFFSDAYNGNTLLNIQANDISVTKCIFGYNADSLNGFSTSINVLNRNGIILQDNIIITPKKSGSNISTGIYLEDCSYGNVLNNTIKTIGSYVQGIACIDFCNYNNIGFNVIGIFSETDASTTTIDYGILFSKQGNYNKIYNNVIGMAGNGASGIEYGYSPTSGKNIEIKNNYIQMFDNDFGAVGIYVPYQSNTVSYFTVINNIIEYTGSNNSGIAMAISIGSTQGMIDYNDIYHFKETNVFFSGGGPNLLPLGRYNIFSNPRLFWSETPLAYPNKYSIENFYCYKNSECIGSGYLHRNIGVGVDPTITTKIDSYINIVDTVTNNYGFGTADRSSYNTFFNSVFTETAQQFNSYYRGTSDLPYLVNPPAPLTRGTSDSDVYYYSHIPLMYPSYLDIEIGVYRDQFEFKMVNPTTFPFSTDDPIFYGKNLTNACFYKDKLAPFEGIKCPPNPGYGFPDYKNYEKGLWGYLRFKYPNSCSLDGCIIQDTIADVIRMQDKIENVPIWTQDSIDPPCITNT